MLLLVAVMCGAAACGSTSQAEVTPTVAASATPDATPESTDTAATAPTWERMTVNGIEIGIEVPPGWDAQKTRDGLLLAEHFGTIQSGTSPQGLQIHLFVHSLAGYELPEAQNSNIAWAVLEQIIAQPDYIGTALVSAPRGFNWDGHDAAYYLLNPKDGSLSLLVAVALTPEKWLVVCNFSSPAQDAAKIRTMLPQILRSLTINGANMDIAALETLPDPLHYPQADTSVTPK